LIHIRFKRSRREKVLKMNELYNMDCMEGMKQFPDKYFELAIVDPPYGIARFGNRVELSNRICKEAKINKWDIKPTQEYFDELFRVSVNQIIWGANNFNLPSTEYFIVWDKQQTVDNFASAEYAWTNIKMPAKVFRYAIHKEMAERKGEGGKIHPTQKPVKLYEWLLANYAKPGDKILDTHVGSASSLIACHNYGFDYIGFEIDKEYYEKAKERLESVKAQLTLF
jgi:site-specific DNA-methyltransferase (adenine-specific)